MILSDICVLWVRYESGISSDFFFKLEGIAKNWLGKVCEVESTMGRMRKSRGMNVVPFQAVCRSVNEWECRVTFGSGHSGV